jgi:hypothetical protein
MQWITENWILLLLGGGMLVMHMFGHGKHGGHGGHGGRRKHDDPDNDQAETGLKKSDDESKATLSPTSVPKSGRRTGKPKPDEGSDDPKP